MFECARCSSPLEDGDLRCCVCALPVATERTSVAKARVSILRCHHCGAAVVYAATSQTLRCGFCGWNGTIEQPVDPIEEAQRLVPFDIDDAEAAAMIRAWLARRGYFAPTALALDAEFEKLTPLYWAAWVVNARAHVAWTADSDDGAGRSAWAPHAGQLVMTFDDIVVPASRGMSRADSRRLVPYYDLSKAVPVEVRQRVMIESFDAQRSAARRQVHHAIESIAKTRVER
ncbi:MAG TPA: hypothetical protein VGO00_17065, partial [Kofleriaceae bacterium]|nr:hypothetical protein [Kofleriaceae bacterium]